MMWGCFVLFECSPLVWTLWNRRSLVWRRSPADPSSQCQGIPGPCSLLQPSSCPFLLVVVPVLNPTMLFVPQATSFLSNVYIFTKHRTCLITAPCSAPGATGLAGGPEAVLCSCRPTPPWHSGAREQVLRQTPGMRAVWPPPHLCSGSPRRSSAA